MNARHHFRTVLYMALFAALSVAHQFGGWQAIRRWVIVASISTVILAFVVVAVNVAIGFVNARRE